MLMPTRPLHAWQLAQRCGLLRLQRHLNDPNLQPLMEEFLPLLCARYDIAYVPAEEPLGERDLNFRIRVAVDQQAMRLVQQDSAEFRNLCQSIHPGIDDLQRHPGLLSVRNVHAQYNCYRMAYAFKPMLLGRLRVSDSQDMEGVGKYSCDTLAERFSIKGIEDDDADVCSGSEEKLKVAVAWVQRLDRAVKLLTELQGTRSQLPVLDEAAVAGLLSGLEEFPGSTQTVLETFPDVPSQDFWRETDHWVNMPDVIASLGECALHATPRGRVLTFSSCFRAVPRLARDCGC